jgi:membrane-anchored glycerophosphoryl diester phosphodiesterase (GDPDase)
MIMVSVPFVMFALGDSGIMIGILLFTVAIVGLFYLSLRLALVPPIVFLEDVGIVGSLRRSFDLLKGHILNTFVLILVLSLISAIPTVVAGQVAGLFGSNLWYMGVVLSYVATALAAPIEPLGLTVYYYSMRAREASSPVPAPPIFLTPS